MNYVSNKHLKLLLPPYKNLAPNSQDQRNPLATGIHSYITFIPHEMYSVETNTQTYNQT